MPKDPRWYWVVGFAALLIVVQTTLFVIYKTGGWDTEEAKFLDRRLEEHTFILFLTRH
jgi:hypothetical protein